jgi:proline utilization trans-activator
MPSNQHSEALLERCREVWWTVYALDSHISALMGCPTTLHEQDITARLPAFGGSIPKSLALDMHVKLSKITASIQQSKCYIHQYRHKTDSFQAVYSKQGRAGSQFLKSMKTALKTLADINDERTAGFPLPLDNPSSSISRLSAHLHLFHHQVCAS